MSFAMWQLAEVPPKKAGTYLVGNRETHEVGQARYMPKKKEWKFPSAQMRFEVQAWAEMPAVQGGGTGMDIERYEVAKSIIKARLTRGEYEEAIAQVVAAQANLRLNRDEVSYTVLIDKRDTSTGFEHFAWVEIEIDNRERATAG